MIDLSKSELDLIAEGIRDNPNDVLKVGFEVVQDELMTLERITAFAVSTGSGVRRSTIAVAKSLRRAGFRQQVVKTDDGTKRLWAVRNREAWAARKPKEFANYYARINSGPKFK